MDRRDLYPATDAAPADATFTEHRRALFAVAYRMLGSASEAEDMVQETWLRWQQQERAAVQTPRAWLTATVTRLCIDQLRSARYRREQYVGVWLPEPLVDTAAPPPDTNAAVADSLRLAFLVLLDKLSPLERAVFLLREVFDHDYEEIAAIVGKSAVNCRQIFSRAKLGLRRSGPPEEAPVPRTADRVVEQFRAACLSGKVQDLLQVITDDVVLYSDGGGRVRAARRPIHTADRVSRFFAGIRQRGLAGASATLVRVNGEPGLLLRRRDGHRLVLAFGVVAGRVATIYLVSNPDKLRHLPPQLEGAGAAS